MEGAAHRIFLSVMDKNYIIIWMWASFLRDIGIILGVPIIIVIGYKLYRYHIDILKEMQKKQIDTLEAENKLPKETQYDKALAIIEAQKKLHQIERDGLEKEISLLISEKSQLEELNKRIAVVYTSADEAVAKLAEILSKKELKHIEAKVWEDFLDRAVSNDISEQRVVYKLNFKKIE
jgi:hypothetical protein